MKYLVYLSFLFCVSATAQDLPALIAEANRLEAIPDEKAAFEKFKLVLKYDPDNLHALTKCSELCSRIGNRQSNTKLRDDYYKAAVGYATIALKHHPKSDEANVVMGIAVGRTVLVKSGKEKIAAVKDIKKYAETALKYNPNNFKAWHIIGKWNYEISNLNMVEKAATKLFYGGLPDASYKASIAAYEKARSLRPDFMLNYLELAKAYKKNGDKEKAIASLKQLLPIRAATEDDPRIKKEAQELLKDWQ